MALPRIAIVGAGSVGCYFGGRLAQAGADVTLIGRPAQVEAITRNGLLFESGGKTETIRVGATTEPEGVRDAAIVLICVKSADTDMATAEVAPYLASDAVLVSLQNGVGNAERIHAGAHRPVIGGLVYVAVSMPGIGRVRHAGGNRIVIGAVRDCGATGALLRDVADAFRAAGVTVDMSADMDGELWAKLMTNCAYNAICALTGKPYGVMGAVPEIRALMREAADEVIALAHRKGIVIPDETSASLLAMTETMAHQMSSTAQDIARGRRTEIDYLNGFVSRESAAIGLEAPVNRTLHALVKLRERAD
ncbi:MAG: 2-dehydropantoate 2-reductase [Pseudolabrys sp.]|jgi:2-dehydropantoate 2-reductase|nr:2-dehydropantoate 2-reductase [Pseudolabrys sp.]